MMQDRLIRLLILERTQEDAEALLNVLRRAGYPIRPYLPEDKAALRRALVDHTWDALIGRPEGGPLSLDQAHQLIAASGQDTGQSALPEFVWGLVMV